MNAPRIFTSSYHLRQSPRCLGFPVNVLNLCPTRLTRATCTPVSKQEQAYRMIIINACLFFFADQNNLYTLKNNLPQSPVKVLEVFCNEKCSVFSCAMLLCTHLLNRIIILLIYMKLL